MILTESRDGRNTISDYFPVKCFVKARTSVMRDFTETLLCSRCIDIITWKMPSEAMKKKMPTPDEVGVVVLSHA